MAQRTKPPRPDALQSDRAVLSALQTLADFAPRNPVCAPAALQALDVAASRAEEALLEAERIVREARSRMAVSCWALHDAVMAAKVEVEAQYGNESFAMRAIGLTPRSERKRPVRRKMAVE